jgi:hypothetical protein
MRERMTNDERMTKAECLISFCRETGRLQEDSPPRLRRGCGAQRHWGGASRCDPAADLAFPRPFEPPPPWPVAMAPLLIQGGEPSRRVSRQKLARKTKGV